MNDPATTGASLDDLLQANKARFEKIFEMQKQQFGRLGAAQQAAAVPQHAQAPSAAANPSPNDAQPPPREPQTTPALAHSDSPPAERRSAGLNALTLTLVENALHGVNREMRAALQYDALASLNDAQGRVMVGQLAAPVASLRDLALSPGDVILQSDPYLSAGAITNSNDCLLLAPIALDGERLGFCAVSGRMTDVGGPRPGSRPGDAASIFAEGLRIPPLKLYDKGELNQAVLDLILNNSRTPQANREGLLKLVDACRVAERGLLGVARRFGKEAYRRAGAALLERSRSAMCELIVRHLPEEPQFFEDVIDDDGRGNGPFTLKLTLWREGEQAYFDWTGSSAQAPGPINAYLHEQHCKIVIARYLISVLDPQLPFNHGCCEPLQVTLPKGTLLQPDFPAPLGAAQHVLARQFDVLTGVLGKIAAQRTLAANAVSARFRYAGVDRSGRAFHFGESFFRQPAADVSSEVLERDYPLRVESYTAIPDSGGAGLRPGRGGMEKIYRLLAAGEASIQDERQRTRPWGMLGGKPGVCSEKWLERTDGVREALAAKADGIEVQPGDRLVFRTAGGGGCGNPLQREPDEVCADVARGLVSRSAARDDYGVVIDDALRLDAAATRALRDRLAKTRKPPYFDFGDLQAQS